MPQVIKESETTTYTIAEDGTQIPHREPVTVFVHCINHACGRFHDPQNGLNFDREVPGYRIETSHTYMDRGGDNPGVENSHVSWQCQVPEDTVCTECGLPVNVSEQPAREMQRHSYEPGFGLAGAAKAAAIAAAKVAEQRAEDDAAREVVDAQRDKELAELKAQVLALTDQAKEASAEDAT